MSEVLTFIAALPRAADTILALCAVGLVCGIAGIAWSMRPPKGETQPDRPAERRSERRKYRDRRDHDA